VTVRSQYVRLKALSRGGGEAIARNVDSAQIARGRVPMSKYLLEITYTLEGVKGIKEKGGSESPGGGDRAH